VQVFGRRRHRGSPHARRAGVQKAPGREVAGSWAAAAGLGVHHFTKNTTGGNPLDRVTGSLAFHALPRCVLVAARDQNGGPDARRALMRAKITNGPDWGGFDYKLDQRPLDDWPQIEAQGRPSWLNP
jgi:hypothetical protein